MANAEEIYEKVVTNVLTALESIRPYLHKDGGDIELVDVKDDTVYVKLLGSCVRCPMSFSTIKLGVENKVKEYEPSIKSVVNVDENSLSGSLRI